MVKPEIKTTEQDKFQRCISRYLDDHLFASGAELGSLLREHFQVTADYARQIVSRVAKSHAVISSRPYTFGKGQYIYLRRGTTLSLAIVTEICKKSRPPIYRLLQALQDNNGILSQYEGMKLTASPGEGTSTKVTALRDILKLLAKLNLVRERTDNSGDVYLFLSDPETGLGAGPDDDIRVRTEHLKLLQDTILLPDILRWLSTTNLFQFQRTQFRSMATPAKGIWQSGLLWDAISYTKTTGINEFNASTATNPDRMTLVAFDVVISKSYTSQQLDGFYNRLQIHFNSVKGNKRKVVPIVVYRDCSPEVLGRMQKLGFLAFGIGSVFGSKIYSILNGVAKLKAYDGQESDVEAAVRSALQAIKEAGQDEALGKVKGILFEILLYPLLSHLFPGSKMMRSKVLKADEAGKQKGYEYDYVISAEHPKEIVVAELKGYRAGKVIALGSDTMKGSLNWFFDKTLPHAQRSLKDEPGKGYPIKAMFITTASFDEGGTQLLKRLNTGSLKPSGLNVAYDRTALLDLLKAKGFDLEIGVIEKYFS